MKKLLFAMILGTLSLTSWAQDVKTFIPKNAYQFLPLVKEEGLRLMPEMQWPHYFGALIEHESCISLKHSRCWQPTSELRSKRERGAGLGQLTIAYNEDGSVRFDSLSDLRRANMRELKELSWSNITQRPDLQIRGIVLMINKSYQSLFEIPDDFQRLAMSDVSYNAGLGRIKKNRLKCSLTQGCDPDIWFDNVEKHCTASTKPIYGGRSACDIMTHHAHDTLYNRLNKYEPFFK